MRLSTEELAKAKKQAMTRNQPATSGELEGPSIDASYFLAQSGLLRVTRVKKTGDPVRMLEVVCTPSTHAVSVEELGAEIERVWADELCFSGQSAHSLQFSEAEVNLDFVTVLPGGRYYTGLIRVSCGR